ncbi:DUF2805 domain-containing protein [Polaribacter atrinae]
MQIEMKPKKLCNVEKKVKSRKTKHLKLRSFQKGRFKCSIQKN